MIQKPSTDTIIEEIHRIRREISDKFGGDFRRMLEDARQRQEESGRPVWQPNRTNKVVNPNRGLEGS